MNLRVRSTLVLLATMLPRQASADVVTEWNVALSRCAEDSLPHAPHLVARAFAITHLGIREAVDQAQADRRHGSSADAHVAAASAAGFAIARTILSMGETEFGALHSRQLRDIPAGADKDFGVNTGARVAASWLAKREDDQWPRVRRADVVTALAVAEQPAAPRPGTSRWQTVTPFIMRSARQFKVEQPLWFSEQRLIPNDRLRGSKALDLPADILSAISPEFWSRDAVVIWNRIARALVMQRPRDLRANARFFSVLNSALADGLLCASHWSVLYEEGAVLKVRFLASDDPRELIPPELRGEYNVPPKTGTVGIPVGNYPDWSAVLAGAARSVMARYGGGQTNFSMESDSSLDGPETTDGRRFASVDVAAKEAVVAGMLSRRCTRESGVAGFELGTSIGNYVMKHSEER